MLNIRKTARGFSLIEFEDYYHHDCSLQESSNIDPCIWLGVGNNRMHLNQEQVKELLPYLQRFVDTGNF